MHAAKAALQIGGARAQRQRRVDAAIHRQIGAHAVLAAAQRQRVPGLGEHPLAGVNRPAVKLGMKMRARQGQPGVAAKAHADRAQGDFQAGGVRIVAQQAVGAV